MKARELIEELLKCDPDANVVVFDDGAGIFLNIDSFNDAYQVGEDIRPVIFVD